ncbi:Protein CBG21487 [Caenorhabditis briggsae]|uniref:Protein CBG21487 n=1 Tax=Caenorhabditis briggsae TaxID=6238 RepID=A8Y054_CAEBR|nr:Protein CBG21487 [Caenorhabditis briggsae]CAP38272.2 Protein CBG21487 [Caenorhabditis briggsae]
MLESPDSPVVVWSRPPSLRSLRTGKRVVPGQYVLDEPDTLCVLPSSMRLVCCMLTLLLICSLIAAILNSLQGSSNGSVSYCKRPEEPFRPDILLAIVCVVLSCLLGISYSFFRYFCRHCHLSHWKPTRLRSDV